VGLRGEHVWLRFTLPCGVTVTTADKNGLVIAQLAERIRIIGSQDRGHRDKKLFSRPCQEDSYRCDGFNRNDPPRLPEFMFALSISESLIQRAETAVSKYGPKLKIIAG